jgi:predicted RNA methylase
LQQFDTPPEIAAMVIEAADIQLGNLVLEPSAGLGALALGADAAGANVHCVEIDPKRVMFMNACDGMLTTWTEDFMNMTANAIYDKVVMNPPFTKGQDVCHVMHAYEFLKPGGRLVAIMSPSFTYRTTAPFTEFREWLEGKMEYLEDLPEGAFKSSGTNVRTVMVVINK